MNGRRTFTAFAILLTKQTHASLTNQLICPPGSDCFKFLEEITNPLNGLQVPFDLARSGRKGPELTQNDCPDGSDGCFSATTTLAALLEFRPRTDFDSLNSPRSETPNLSRNLIAGMGVTGTGTVTDYGCWCYDKNDPDGTNSNVAFTGFGRTVDSFDEACKAHLMSCDCIEKKDDGCIAQEQMYEIEITKNEEGEMCIKCANPDNVCQYKACLNDMQYTSHQWSLIDSNEQPDYAQYAHYINGVRNFDPKVSCPLQGQPIGNGPKANTNAVCCGDYPFRTFYDENNTDGITCCEHSEEALTLQYGYEILKGKTYNELTHQCCDDGVKVIGDVCV